MMTRIAPSRQRRLLLVASCVGVLTACSSTPRIIPDTVVKIGPTVSYPLESLVYWGAYIGAAYLILDPLAPNWKIEEARFPDNHVHFSLSMKRFYAGGAGEARVIFHRRAKEMMRAGGFKSYEVVEYSEGMESSVLGSQRTASGVVRFS